MLENWPLKVSSQEKFFIEYETKLRNPFNKGKRGLFLYSVEGQTAGLANAFITENNTTCINIAEFYVAPTFRGKGIESEMTHHLIEWGKEEGASRIRIEVDKELESANRF